MRARTAWLLAAFCTHAHAADTVRGEGEWLLDQWTVDDGLPVNHLSAITQADDGAIWFTTFDGIVRFDGHDFETYRRSEHPELPTNRFVDLATRDDGTLWFVAESGELVSLEDGHFEVHTDARTVRVVQAQDDSIVAWGFGGVFRYDARGATQLAGKDASRLVSLVEDDVVWSGRSDGQVERIEGGIVVDTLDVSGDVMALRRLHDTLWIATHDGVWAYDGALARVRDDPACVIAEVEGQAVAATQTGWWGLETGELLLPSRQDCAWHDGEFSDGWLSGESLWLGSERVGTPNGQLGPTFVDADGDLWFGEIGSGLRRARRRLVHSDTGSADVPFGNTRSVRFDGDVRWVTSVAGVFRGNTRIEASHLDKLMETAHSTARDGDGNTWVGLSTAVCRVEGDTCVAEVPPTGTCSPRRIVYTTRDGTLYSGEGCALWRREGDQWDQVPTVELPEILDITEDRDGALLLATFGHGILRVGDNLEQMASRPGMSTDNIRAIRLDDDGVAWLGTVDGGVCGVALYDGDRRIPLEQARATCIGRSQGLFDDAVHVTFEDDLDRLWMSTNRGMGWVRLSEVDAIVEGRARHVLPVVYDERHGLADREGNGGTSPVAAVDADGRMHFATQAGVAVVDPASIPIPEAPVVQLGIPVVNGERMRDDPIELPPGVHQVSLDWHAVVLDLADQVRFRHRVVGRDTDWSPPSTQRSLNWRDLPPGRFEIEVQAGLGGAWGPIARRSLVRAPALAEQPWFPAALVGLAALALLGLAGIQVRRGRARQVLLEATVADRTRALATTNSQLREQAAATEAQKAQVEALAQALSERNRDIAAQAKRLEEVDALKTRIVANLSHELRTPLSLVLGPLGDIDVDRMSERDRGRLDVVRRNGRRLAELVDQLFAMRDLESGEFPLRATRRDLGGFVREVASRFATEMEAKGLRFTVQTPEGGLLAWFDTDLLDKAVSNLLENARKFTETGAIDVSVSATDAHARIDVRDTGVGIPASQLDQVFQRFHQVADDRPVSNGAGIGLALVAEIAALHGGGAYVDSLRGTGSTFTLELPLGTAHLSPEDIALDGAPRPVEVTETAEGATVLIVEDNADLRAYLVEHLAEAFEVLEAEDGAQGLALAQLHRPTVIVSDVMMPNMDGLALGAAIARDAELAATPLVLVSAKGTAADRRAGEAVAEAYFTKPFVMRDLVAKVAELAATKDAPELPEHDRLFVDKLEAVVARNLDDPQFNVTALASAMALSRRQLQRDVRRLLGMTPAAYLRSVRLSAADDLLARGRYSTVGEVAAAVGMSRAYFVRVYRSAYGAPPSQVLAR
jgi:signal transduction histidine kinase/DNA-binding response OmpR family regulator/ligand-binding sensor domain-containing protein